MLIFQTFLSGMETEVIRSQEDFERGLSDLPIRDGNSLRSISRAAAKILSDLPIRDGNSSSETLPALMPPSFRPSYQGWKQIRGHHDAIIWRPLSDLPIRDGNTCIAPTGTIGLLLSDLPIRDGNSLSSLSGNSRYSLSDLPIRDGNC